MREIKHKIYESNNWKGLKAHINSSSSTKEMGDTFELLTKLYLKIDPTYVSKLEYVWLYSEVPTNVLKKLNLPTRDMGIDIIAQTFQGEYWAIQCKYKSDESSTLTWREISTFQSLAFSRAKGITAGLIATTTDRSSSLLKGQKENVKLLSGDVWRSLNEEFFKSARAILNKRRPALKPFKPRPHQNRAIKNAHKHFVKEKASRGKMIMPCGAGKSLTAYWIADKLEAKTIVIAVPSLSLIRQTYQAWLREIVANKQTVDWIAVCSDQSVGESDVAVYTQDLGVPTTTDSEFIAKWLRKRPAGLKIVFTTYQSGKVLGEAFRAAKRVFDLGIMDEAHKTVGDREKSFAHLLFDENIKIRKRVFMTATERRYSGNRDEIISMDDPEVYGDTFELLSFKEALEQNPPILSDYKILTMMVDKEDIAKYIQDRAIVKPDRGKWDDGVQAEMLAGVVALQKAMEKYPIKHAVSFHSSIAKAQAFQKNQEIYSDEVDAEPGTLSTYFVSGKTPTSIRSRKIQEFADSEKSLITNARCLTEGVDVPKIDGILFADPKKSTVDIVQAVGRALRTADEKEFGYIIIPVLIESEDDFEKSNAYQSILSVLRALASNDERIIEYFREKSETKKPAKRLVEHEGTELLFERVKFDQFVESIELQAWNKLAKLSWRSYENARRFIQTLGLKTYKQWIEYFTGQLEKLPPKPFDIPTSPAVVYRGRGWKGYGDWLGTYRQPDQKIDFATYDEAKTIVQRLNIKTRLEYLRYVKGKLDGSKFLHKPLPTNPHRTYMDEWRHWGEFLGTHKISPKEFQYRSFEDARLFVRTLKLNSRKEWIEYTQSKNYPIDIPKKPERVYKDEGWLSTGDWLGSGVLATNKRTYVSYDDAKKYVHSLNLGSSTQWQVYLKSNDLPSEIPRKPYAIYKDNGWIDWADFLGFKKIEWREYGSAKKFAVTLNLYSSTEWKEYMKGKFPDKPDPPKDIPATPDKVYEDTGWGGWNDFLGKKGKRRWREFSEARRFAHSLNLRNNKKWRLYTKGEIRDLPTLPRDIPSNPSTVYKDSGWVGFTDWLGHEPYTPKEKEYRSYEDAKKYVKKFGFLSQQEFYSFIRGEAPNNPDIPSDIPKAPVIVYKRRGVWKGWNDFLGKEQR